MTQIGTVTGQEIKKNRDGSIAVRLLQVQISNESDVHTVQYMNPAGEDSAPINGDKVEIHSIGPAFKFALAVEDQNNAASMPSGEKNLYARDDNGAIKIALRLRKDGKISVTNDANELMVVLSDLIQHLIDARVLTSLGPQPFLTTTIANFTADKGNLDTFKV